MTRNVTLPVSTLQAFLPPLGLAPQPALVNAGGLILGGQGLPEAGREGGKPREDTS